MKVGDFDVDASHPKRVHPTGLGLLCRPRIEWERKWMRIGRADSPILGGRGSLGAGRVPWKYRKKKGSRGRREAVHEVCVFEKAVLAEYGA